MTIGIYRSKHAPRSTGRFVALSATMLLLAAVSQQSWAMGARGVLKDALAPAQLAMTSAAARLQALAPGFGDVSRLRAENERLAAADATLRGQVLGLDAATRENAALRQALDFRRSSGYHTVAAAVIGLGPDGLSRTIEIDRGTADGIRPGMVVVTGAGLFGRVSEAGPHVANVSTIADPNVRLPVYLPASNLLGTVSGGATLQLELQHWMTVVASPGEWALTSGAGGDYPRGLVVGEVTSVTHREVAATDLARVAWVNGNSAAGFVLVITDFVPS
jgi:rod shape-determining protein MreC